ncbi:AMP-binding protein, partial [Pseudomonas asplenii]
ERLLGDLREVLQAFAEGIDRDFQDLVATLQAPLALGRDTDDAPGADLDQGYAQLFRRTVQRVPQQVAATCQGQGWTYAELDRHSDRLAVALQASGVVADDLVAVLGERGLP